MVRATNRFAALRPGSVIDVVAPASACSEAELTQGLDVIEAWGYRPRVPPALLGPKYIYSNPDPVRWDQLRRALSSSSSRAVWCVRGGYGSGRLLPHLSRIRRAYPEKPFIGFSDITAVHGLLVAQWRWTTWHGPVLTQLRSGALDEASLTEVRGVLSGDVASIQRTGLVPLNDAAAHDGTCGGRLVGGNLKTLQSLLGTPWALQARGSIVVLEDVNERGYSVDRMLFQMHQSGALGGARAIVFGDFTGGNESNGVSTTPAILQEFAERLKIPVMCGLPFGHSATAKVLPLGMVATLNLGTNASLAVNWDVT